MKDSVAAGDLTFSTPDDKGFPYVLFLCVLGSLLAHAGTFFLFHVVYPQRVTIPQPAPRVSLLTPSSPENVALLRWIEAEDPALVANDDSVSPPGLVDVHYRPSFASPRTAPLGAPPEQVQAVRFPRAEDHLSVTDSPILSAESPASVASLPTSVAFSGELRSRPIAAEPPMAFDYRATDPAKPTSVLLGVNEQGEVRFSLVQESSGDQRLDDLALAHLRQIVFAPAPSAMTWGFATFLWGSDAYHTASLTP
jgi:hypothetical protein